MRWTSTCSPSVCGPARAVPDTAQTIASGAVYSTVGARCGDRRQAGAKRPDHPACLLLIAWGWNRRGDETGVSAETTKRSLRRAFPIFLVGFLALALVRTARLVDPERVADIDTLTRACFVVALAGFGLQTRLGQIRAVGAKPFLLGFATFALLGAGSLGLILVLGLGPARTEVLGGTDPRPLGRWTPVCAGEARRCGEADQATADLARNTSIRTVRLRGRLLASGIPGAGALSPVGTFHPGGPMHDKREFAALTRAGEMLGPDPPAGGEHLQLRGAGCPGRLGHGSDPLAGHGRSGSAGGERPSSPPPGCQAGTLDGAVQLYTAQAPSFLNRVPNSEADTADMPAVSNPLGISVNNAFGRPWFANAPRSDGSRHRGRIGHSIRMGGRWPRPPASVPVACSPGALTNRVAAKPSRRPAGGGRLATRSWAPHRTPRAGRCSRLPPPTERWSRSTSRRASMAWPRLARWLRSPGWGHRQTHPRDPRTESGWSSTGSPIASCTCRIRATMPILQLRLDDDFEVFNVIETRRLQSPYLSAPDRPRAGCARGRQSGLLQQHDAGRRSGPLRRQPRLGHDRAACARMAGSWPSPRSIVPGFGVVGAGRLNGIAVSAGCEQDLGLA